MHNVDKLIDQRMFSEHAPLIRDLTGHLISAGGKRLRPLLTLASAALCDYKGGYHIHLAAVVEFIHSATLLHDDVIDESLQRRGEPTANILWDNKSSVLVGDFLFSRAFQLMVETGSIAVLDSLSNASAEISESEVLQMSLSQNLLSFNSSPVSSPLAAFRIIVIIFESIQSLQIYIVYKDLSSFICSSVSSPPPAP